MSCAMIELLNASVERPSLPPQVGFGNESAAEETRHAASSSGFTDSGETELRRADPGKVAQIRGEYRKGSRRRPADSAGATDRGSDPDLWLYRDRTVALLRRYMRLSIEVGRLPSLLGREFFRSRVTTYRASTFEDAVIFVHDMERSLEQLSDFEKRLIAKVVLQQYTKRETGRALGCGYRTIERLFPQALDRTSEILLRRGILTRLPETKNEGQKSCQEEKDDRSVPRS